ncbi:hypothetical protein BLNAU_18531 [Blattamonas nauphoetae]|uniref:Uncharacterized protein n=1 Tax=Blattamonas nauphoetae TaxID=2049346 RepID=A0ABQ9X8Q3_9EUKA|nr:hypothetical protein BLNAU_18531 [Blattamonas nauphoetae]
MPQNPSIFPLNSLITACSFQNMTSHRLSSSFKPKLQGIRLIDSTMENVENGLYGTVTPEICHHKEFSCTNCSIVECTNTENDGLTKEIEEDRSFTSSAEQIKVDSTFSHYSFTSCTFTATNTTTSFTLIYNCWTILGNWKMPEKRQTKCEPFLQLQIVSCHSTTLPFVAMLGVLWENDRPSAVDPMSENVLDCQTY